MDTEYILSYTAKEIDEKLREIDGLEDCINTKISNAIANIDLGLPRIEKEATDTVCVLEPNTLYVFPEMRILNITLGGAVNKNIIQEYKFRFISGDTATTLILPESVRGNIVTEENSVVEVSIVDNFAICQTWEAIK
jgi:hypothetical protein